MIDHVCRNGPGLLHLKFSRMYTGARSRFTPVACGNMSLRCWNWRGLGRVKWRPAGEARSSESLGVRRSQSQITDRPKIRGRTRRDSTAVITWLNNIKYDEYVKMIAPIWGDRTDRITIWNEDIAWYSIWRQIPWNDMSKGSCKMMYDVWKKNQCMTYMLS
jgi:hypothetical protein